MRALHISQIEGAIVTFPFFTDGKYVKNGEWLTSEVLARMPISNRNSLQDKGYIYPIPRAAVAAMGLAAPVAVDAPAKRYVVSCGFGRFNVIEGDLLNEKPVSKEAAYELAGLQLPDKETQ